MSAGTPFQSNFSHSDPLSTLFRASSTSCSIKSKNYVEKNCRSGLDLGRWLAI